MKTNWKAHIGQRLLVRPYSFIHRREVTEVKLLEISESGEYLLFEYPGPAQLREWKLTSEWEVAEVLPSVSEADIAVRIMRLVHELRAGEGWGVEIMSDIPDGPGTAVVNISNEFTWRLTEMQDLGFCGRDLEDALTQAVVWLRERLKERSA